MFFSEFYFNFQKYNFLFLCLNNRNLYRPLIISVKPVTYSTFWNVWRRQTSRHRSVFDKIDFLLFFVLRGFFILWRKIVKDRLKTYISAVQISLDNRIQIFIVTTFISFLGKKVFLSSLRLSIKRSPRNWKIWLKIGYAWQYFLISIWTHVWKVTIKYCCYSVLFNNSTFFVKNWTLQAIVILHFGFANYSLNILQMFLIMLSNFLFWKSSF